MPSFFNFKLASALALPAVSFAMFDPTATSRRGLAIENAWVATLHAPEAECEALRVKIDDLKRELAGGAARLEPSEDIPISELCWVSFTGSQEVADAVRERFPEIVTLEPDMVVEPAAPASWGLDRVDQVPLPLDGANFNPQFLGAGQTVYVIDTGTNAQHVDFGGRARQAINYSNEANVDINGHGSHCAGTVGGNTYGIAREATIVGVKVLGQNGGSNTNVARGVRYAVQQQQGKGPGVISMSLGGGASAALDQVVTQAAQTMMVIVAAGNENQNACNVSPARAGGKGNVITVGSSTRTDTMSGFSNWGNCVDLFAPGSGITSAWIGSTTATKTISGTSMATPHVAGVAATLLEKHNGNMQAARQELFSLTVNGALTGLGPQSPNKLLQAPLPAAAPTPTPPAPTPTPPAPTPTPPAPPAGTWTCPQAWLNANDGCDCSCGTQIDPDCRKPTTTRLYCRGRGARWYEVCLESTGECVSRYDLMEDVDKDGVTLPPTMADQPSNKEGVENGVEFPPPVITGDDETIEDLGPFPGTGTDTSGPGVGAVIGATAGVVALVAAVAMVAQRKRNQASAGKQQQQMQPSQFGVAPHSNPEQML